MESTSEAQQPTTAVASSSGGRFQPHSCILCKQRKVKCDKHYPCNACTKARVQCIYRAPAPPRRGKRKPSEASMLARLKKYEDMLQTLGVSVEKMQIGDPGPYTASTSAGDGPGSPSLVDTAGAPKEQKGMFLAEEGKSIYLETNLWKNLSEELEDPNEIFHESDDSEDDEIHSRLETANYNITADPTQIILGSGRINPVLRVHHPSPEHVLKLWQLYTENVNPLCMILHVPTTYATILEASRNLDHVPKNLEALLFAIYSVSVYTLDEEECEEKFGESKAILLARYQLATRQAFIRVGLMRSVDIVMSQAYLLYLFSVRSSTDIRTLWILTGIGVRIALRIGLHRDGSKLSLSPFESEMRRRLWWQVIILDTHSTQLSGVATMLRSDSWDAELPLNINDSQLYPEMTEPPVEQEGATEMFFCMVRFEFGKVFRPIHFPNVPSQPSLTNNWIHPDNMSHNKLLEKDRLIDETERIIGDKYLRYCDAFNDLHMLSVGVARTALASMRLLIHHPRQYSDRGASLPQSEKDALFSNGVKILQYDCTAYTTKNLRRFSWHFSAYFQYNGFVFLLSELCHRTQGAEVDKAWELVNDALRNHRQMVDDPKRTLHAAVGNLTSKAWRAYISEQSRQGKTITTPYYISKLVSNRLAMASSEISTAATSPSQVENSTPSTIPTIASTIDPSNANVTQKQPLPTYPAFNSSAPLTEAHTTEKELSNPYYTAFPAAKAVTNMYGVSDSTDETSATLAGKSTNTKNSTGNDNNNNNATPQGTDYAFGGFTGDFSNPALLQGGNESLLQFEQPDSSPMDWAAWDELIQDDQMPFLEPDGFGFQDPIF